MKKITLGLLIGLFLSGGYAFAFTQIIPDYITSVGNSTSIYRFKDVENPNVICYVAQINSQGSNSNQAPSISCLSLAKAPVTNNK